MRNLEMRFAQLNKEIKGLIGVKDYKTSMKCIVEANDICKKMCKEFGDQCDKDLWNNNSDALSQLYDYCQSKLGSKENDLPPSLSKPAERLEQPIENTAGELRKEMAPPSNPAPITEINPEDYVVNNIDVSQFLITSTNDNVTFDDICGMVDEKKIIQREFFITERQRKFREEYLKQKNKNFILLYGVPGTGKTYFAKAISNEFKKHSEQVNVPFFAVESSKLKDSKVGASEKNIQAIFEFCSKFERAVLFLDEFDALVPDRKINTGDPTAKTNVTTFLTMIDGFNSSKGTLVIAATNYPEQLDTAILSRVNTKINVPLPSVDVIKKMLERKVGELLAEDVNLSEIVESLNGYSSRDIDHVVEGLKEQLADSFYENESNQFNEFKITNEMFDKVIKKVKPSVTAVDLKRIEKFGSVE